MPNHIYSSITFYGSEEDLNKVKNTITESGNDSGKSYTMHISFDKIIPMPADVYRGNLGQEEEKKYGRNNWYHWSVDNWGTKWNAYAHPDEEPEITSLSNALKYITGRDQMRLLTYHFQTAWSPVPKILMKLSEMFPKTIIRYTYIDEGGSFAGIDFYHNKQLLEEEEITDNRRKINQLMNPEVGHDPAVLTRKFKKVMKEHSCCINEVKISTTKSPSSKRKSKTTSKALTSPKKSKTSLSL